MYILGSAGLVRNIGRSATFVFLPLVFADVYHLSYFVIGVLIASIVPVSTLSMLAGGYLTDRVGRRPFAMFPSFGSAVILSLLFVFLDRGVTVVMVLWACNSMLGGLTRPAQSAMIGDVTAPEHVVTAFGVQRVFVNTGFAISPAVGGFLAATAGLPVLFLFGAGTSLIEGTLLLLLLRETYSGRRDPRTTALGSISEPFRDSLFVWLLVALAGLAILMNQFGTPLALYLGSVRALDFTGFGLVYAVNGALVVALQLPISRLIERRQQYLASLTVGTLAYGASFLLFDSAASLPFFLVAMGILTIGEDIVSPTQQTLVARFGGIERRGRYFGAYNASTNVARVVGPLVGTLLLGAGSIGPTLLWGTMFATAVVVAGAFLYLRARVRRRIARGLQGGTSPLPSEVLLSGRE